MGLNTTVVPTNSQVACEVGGDVLLLELERGEYYGFRGAGPLIWDLIQTPRPVSELCEAERARYAVGEAHCAADVEAFLHSLVGHGRATPVGS